MSWDDLIGHEWAVRRLRSALARGTLGQSLLFIGPPQVGKTTLALALAESLLARDTRTRALVAQRKHADLFMIAPEGDSETISIERVRELQHILLLAPVESRHRVAILTDAQALSMGAMNALLKTLEEPPPGAVLVLTATTADALLPTILSRCQVLQLRPVPRALLETGLRARGASPTQAAALAALAHGRVGWALQALQDASVLHARLQAINDLFQLLSANHTARFAYAEQLARAGDIHVRATLQAWQHVWRDVARAALGSATSIGWAHYDEAIRRVASQVPGAVAAACLQRMARTEQVILQNANARLALDVLLTRLPRLSSAPSPLSLTPAEAATATGAPTGDT